MVIMSSQRVSCDCAGRKTASNRQLWTNATGKKPVEVAYQDMLKNIAFTWSVQLLYTIYSPAEHELRTVHKTNEEGDKEEKDGKDEGPAWSEKSKSQRV